MKRFRLLAVVGALVALAAVPLAYASGLFPGLPIVGQAAYCVGYSSYSTSVTSPTSTQSPIQCNTTSPAGPAALTGLELAPADTQIGNYPPATVSIPIPLMSSGPYVYNLITNAVTNVTIPNLINNYILDETTSIATMSITLPSSPLNGQVVNFTSTHLLTLITFLTSGIAGSQISGAVTTFATPTTPGTGGISFLYDSVQNYWYRVH